MATLTQLVKRKLNKHSRPKKSMAKSKSSTKTIVLSPDMRMGRFQSARAHARFAKRRGGELFKGGLGTIKRTLDEPAKALGYGTIAVAAYSKIQPNGSMQTAQLAGLAGEYFGGGFKGVIGAELIKAIAGVTSVFSGLSLGGIFGGGGGQQQMNTGGGSGFL